MNKIKILYALLFGAIHSQVAFAEVPPEIEQLCKQRWGTDYEMQLFCIKEQLQALSVLKGLSNSKIAAPKKSLDGTFLPASTTAIKITGKIRIDGNRLDFHNGESVTFVRDERKYSDRQIALYVSNGQNPELLFGNKLCDVSVKKIVMLFSSDDEFRTLELAVFCDVELPAKLPADLFSVKGLAGTFSYTVTDEVNWAPEANIEQSFISGAIEAYCEEKFSFKVKPKKWKSCVENELAARKSIDRSNSTPDQIATCYFHSVGGRGTGSMEYISAVPVAKCLKTQNSEVVFANCVLKSTRKKYLPPYIHWDFEAAEKIESCWSRSLNNQ